VDESTQGADGGTTANGHPLLKVRQLSVTFGGLKAVDHFDVDVYPETVVGLIGPNGAGKTSLLDGISGFVPAHGSVILDGEEIDGLAPFKRVRAGLGRTFQTSDPLRELSTADLIKINNRDAGHRWNLLRRKPESNGSGDDLLTRVLALLGEVETFASKPVAQLPTGIRRLVSVAAAVATRPRVLMLDEPAAGLSAHEAVELTRAIHLLRENGVGVLVVDHNVGFVTRTCDHVYAMHFGKQIFAGTPEEMHRSPEVASVYLGDVPQSVT